ncbi:hypothetical protein K7X08_008031 [Anisodus acutangulus]|uniref:Glutathione transferase n=1 Tax=Anisodus acutangulus TaxID=402998 RepID=A0A9Q1MPV0_9SOLA|nr:hypothetical protein K7X08_008031 [Anisodus acutangulus]
MEFDNSHKKATDSTWVSKIVMYSFWQSSCSWRVRFALNLKEFDKLNPLHYVHVLVDGDVVISDSYAILLLEEKYHQRPLLPVEPQLRALNLQAASIVSSNMQPLHMLSRYMEESVGPEEKQLWAKFHIQKGFRALEKLLSGSTGKYATGKEVYMADVFLAPQIAVATKRFNIDMSEFPTLRKIYDSCKALPEFQASLPERQPDAAL